MEYFTRGNDIILKQQDFNLAETLDCGQAFRWTADGDGFTGFFLDRPLTILNEKDYFVLKNTSEEELLNVWTDYFDLNTDYGELKRLFSQDETLSKACAYAGGIRLLRQDFFECLISFIISQNNNIPRIKGIISRLCEHYGHFPSASEMALETPESLGFLRAGFRAKYLIDAAQKTADKLIKPEEIRTMPIDEARKTLMQIKGVGPKVAECVLLFGTYRTEAFPVDVWIKRVMERFYPNGLPDVTRGIEGIAQQYLFHYVRNLNPQI